MAIDIISRYGNSNVVVENYCIQTAQTSGNTTITLFESDAIPVNTAVNIQAIIVAVDSTFTKARTGAILGTFYRGVGNLTRDGNPNVITVGTLGVSADLTANIATQGIDLTVSGVNAVLINYRATIVITIYQ